MTVMKPDEIPKMSKIIVCSFTQGGKMYLPLQNHNLYHNKQEHFIPINMQNLSCGPDGLHTQTEHKTNIMIPVNSKR